MLTLSSAFPIALALVTSSASTSALPLVLPPPIFLLILLLDDDGVLASSSANFCIVACRLLARLISSLHCSWKGS